MPLLKPRRIYEEELLKTQSVGQERPGMSSLTVRLDSRRRNSSWMSALQAIGRSSQQWRHVYYRTQMKCIKDGPVFVLKGHKKRVIWIIFIIIFALVLVLGSLSVWYLSNAVRQQGLLFPWPFIRRCILGPLPADRQEVIPREHDAPLEQWKVRIQRFLPGGKLGDQQSLDQVVDILRNECDFLWLTTSDGQKFLSDPHMQWYLRNHEEWFANQRLPARASPCRVLMTQPHDLPAWAKDFPDYTNTDSYRAHHFMDRYKGRYHAMIAFHEITAGQSELKGDTQNLSELFAAYTDFDVFFSNTSRSWRNVIDHLDRGVKRFARGGSTMESRLCDSWSSVKNTRGHPFPCYHESRFEAIRSKLKGAKDIALAIAMDNFAGGGWMMNSGVLLFQPRSHTSRFIAEAVLTIMSNIRLRHAFDFMEQSRLTYVLNQTFNLDMDALKWASTFDKDDFNGVFGNAGTDTEKDEILMLGLFDIDAAFQHPLFRQAAKRWKKRTSALSIPEADEPMGVTVVFPRWMNAPACNRNWVELGNNRDARFFHCGDFLGHFNGCGKDEIYNKTLRQRISAQCNNSSDWPMVTNDDGSSFDWETWEAEANLDEPAKPSWFGSKLTALLA